MAWVALQVHVQSCLDRAPQSLMLLTTLCHSYGHLLFFSFAMLSSFCCFQFCSCYYKAWVFWQSSLYLRVPDYLARWWLVPHDAALWSLKLCRSKQRLVSITALQLLSITGLKPVSTSHQLKGLFCWSTPGAGFLPGSLLMPSKTRLGKTSGFSKDGVKIGPWEKKITGGH